MMNAITTTRPAGEASNPLIPTTLDEAARLAKIMSDMELVPAHLRGKPADCMLIIEQAIRWRMSPFAVAQATSVLQGKLNFEGKLVAAALHTSGILATRLRYDYEGEGQSRAARVSAVLHGEKEPREVLVKLADVKTANSMWTKQPDQQLSYAGARIWARRHAPEVMLGVYAPEEFDPDEPRQERQVQSTVVRQEPRPEPKPQAAGPTLDQSLNGDQIPDFDAPPPPKPDRQRKMTDRIKERLAEAQTQDAYNEVLGHSGISAEWAKIRDTRPELAAELDAARVEALDRITAADQGDAAEPDQDAA